MKGRRHQAITLLPASRGSSRSDASTARLATVTATQRLVTAMCATTGYAMARAIIRNFN
jgi:hypothetical protein